MIKKLNTFINSSICVSMFFIILGIIMMMFPKTSLNILSYALSLLLIINGIYFIFLEIKMKNQFIPIDTLLTGILSILFGIIMLSYPNMLSIIIPVILGTIFIITSIFKIRIALSLKEIPETPWVLTLIMAILSIICGIVLIIDPISSSVTLTLLAGIIMIIYSITDIVDMIVFKKHINKIAKQFKKAIKIIEEE